MIVKSKKRPLCPVHVYEDFLCGVLSTEKEINRALLRSNTAWVLVLYRGLRTSHAELKARYILRKPWADTLSRRLRKMRKAIGAES